VIRVPVTKNYTIRGPTGETIAADVRIIQNFFFKIFLII
jgi:hypothetical protein